jgi:hypothetical protein
VSANEAVRYYSNRSRWPLEQAGHATHPQLFTAHGK